MKDLLKSDQLNIDNVYRKYVDLYIHLDNLRFGFLGGIWVLAGGLISIAKCFENSSFFFAIFGLCLIIIGWGVKIYRGTIQKFCIGQDYICLVLAEIEEKNTQIFREEILSPMEGKEFISFYSRRKCSILKDKQCNIHIQDPRQSQIHREVLKNLSILLVITGLILIICNMVSFLVYR